MAEIIDIPGRSAPRRKGRAPTPQTIAEEAPAKINLALHVTGRRADGYHLIESVVVFADIADRLRFSAAETDSIALAGRFAPALHGLSEAGNLVARARDRLRDLVLSHGLPAPPVAILLEKNLPVAAGLGGGSADAAATLRGLARLWGLKPSTTAKSLGAIALGLGADVPMCLVGAPLVARGIGEAIAPLPAFPALHLVIANPGLAVSTPSVFAALNARDNRPPPLPGDWRAGIADTLLTLRNDLEPAALGIAPPIAETIEALQSGAPRLVRMSGSGATCFALHDDAVAAGRAARDLARARPGWFVAACRTRPAGPGESQ